MIAPTKPADHARSGTKGDQSIKLPGAMAGRGISEAHPEGLEPPTLGSEDRCSFAPNSLNDRLGFEDLSSCLQLLQVWPLLPQSIRSAILLMVQPWAAGESSQLPPANRFGGGK
jgi:hypothetical protein